uniref:Uncharacterized protein n=1 Tax=Arion vulgaris TaxID=1028688 RepID=A0A0B7B2U9_9EUPU
MPYLHHNWLHRPGCYLYNCFDVIYNEPVGKTSNVQQTKSYWFTRLHTINTCVSETCLFYPFYKKIVKVNKGID